MGGEPNSSTSECLRRLFRDGSVAGMDEPVLLERFARRRDEAAFAAIVARHGPMVLGVCHRLLNDPGDVDDAFQATFLVLVRRAGSIRDASRLGPWLHGVARRVAIRARMRSARRREVERLGLETGLVTEPEAEAADRSSEDLDRMDLRDAIDEEIARLPDSLRQSVILCDLGGRSQADAARDLGISPDAVRGRLARARRRLRSRLARRGLSPSNGAMAAVIGLKATKTAAAVPSALLDETVAIATRTATLGASAGTVPVAVAALSRGVLRTMLWTRLAAGLSAVLVVGAVSFGAGVLAGPWSGHGPLQDSDEPLPAPDVPGPIEPGPPPAPVETPERPGPVEEPPRPVEPEPGTPFPIIDQPLPEPGTIPSSLPPPSTEAEPPSAPSGFSPSIPVEVREPEPATPAPPDRDDQPPSFPSAPVASTPGFLPPSPAEPDPLVQESPGLPAPADEPQVAEPFPHPEPTTLSQPSPRVDPPRARMPEPAPAPNPLVPVMTRPGTSSISATLRTSHDRQEEELNRRINSLTENAMRLRGQIQEMEDELRQVQADIGQSYLELYMLRQSPNPRESTARHEHDEPRPPEYPRDDSDAPVPGPEAPSPMARSPFRAVPSASDPFAPSEPPSEPSLPRSDSDRIHDLERKIEQLIEALETQGKRNEPVLDLRSRY